MPRKRTRKKRKARIQVAAWQWEFLCRGRLSEYPEAPAAVLNSIMFSQYYLPAWELCREELLRAWIEEKPGTRPWAWWEQAVQEYGVRKRLGGVGMLWSECLAYLPSAAFGIPCSWLDNSDVELFRSVNPNFKGVAFDKDNPPLYETEAAFLQRHGLLTESELKADLCTTGHVSVVEIHPYGCWYAHLKA